MPGRRSAILILLLLAAAIAFRAHLPLDAFWISDSGNKRITVESIAVSGFRSVSVGYPGAGLDPSFRFFPRSGDHFLPVGNRMYALSPFHFPAVSAPLFVAFGSAGLYAIPLAAFAGILLLLRGMARNLGVRDDVVILAAALGSPLLFYGLQFWEHTLAVFLSTAGVALLLREPGSARRRYALAAGALLAASTVFREEGYIVMIAVALALIPKWRDIGLTVAGFAAVIVPHWLLQQAVYGHWLGLHLASHETGESPVVTVARNVGYFLFRLHEQDAIAALLALPAVAVLAAGALRHDAPRLRIAALAIAAAAAATGVVMLLSNADPIANAASTQGLFLAFPLILLVAAVWLPLLRASGAIGTLARVTVVYVVLMPLALRANWTGIIWGPRYFLPIVPFVALLLPVAWKELRNASPRVGLLRTAAGVLVVSAIALQMWGLVLLDRKLHASDHLRGLLASLDERVIVTDVFWLPEEMGAIFYDRIIMSPQVPDDVPLLVEVLRRGGVQRFVYVTSTRFGFRGPEVREAMSVLRESRIAFVERRVPLLNVTVDRCRVPAPPSPQSQ